MKSEATKTAQQTFVVTAIFVKHMTIKAKSVSHALQLSEDQGLLEHPAGMGLSNWHATGV